MHCLNLLDTYLLLPHNVLSRHAGRQSIFLIICLQKGVKGTVNNDPNELWSARLKDLAAQSYQNNIYTFSPFLSIAEQEIFYRNQRELSYAGASLWGGYADAERRLAVFGSETLLGYKQPDFIALLLIKPLQLKFSDELTHRDFLGAILNLGIERDTIGDILVKPSGTLLFCLQSVSDTVIRELTRVKHTSVSVTEVGPDILEENDFKPRFEVLRDSAASLRADCVIAGACKLSRGTAQELFKAGYVTLNGRILEKCDTELKPGDIFTVRGHGKYIFDETSGTSRKGRLWISVRHYI